MIRLGSRLIAACALAALMARAQSCANAVDFIDPDYGGRVRQLLKPDGQTDPPGVDGKPGAAPLPKPVHGVSVLIGGVPAEVTYAGGAPGQVAGLLQVNARIPPGLTARGALPLVLIIGDRSSQPGVTLAIE